MDLQDECIGQSSLHGISSTRHDILYQERCDERVIHAAAQLRLEEAPYCPSGPPLLLLDTSSLICNLQGQSSWTPRVLIVAARNSYAGISGAGMRLTE